MKPIPTILFLLVATTLFVTAAAATAPAAPAPPPNGALTITGKLATGVMAIGGETTGIVINDGKTSYELDIKDALLMRKANELNGKQVKVTGTLTVKAGVEVAQRRI